MATPTTTAADLPDHTAHLPDDPAVLKAMLVEFLQALRSSQRESEQLRARLDGLLRRLYGPRAERFDPHQALLFAEPTPGPTPAVPAADTADSPQPRRRGHGRQQLPAHLQRQRRVHELPEVQRLCPCCGKTRPVWGQEVSEQLEYVPAAFLVIEHVRLTYACLDCEKQCTSAAPVVAAPAATVSHPLAGSTLATAAKPAQPLPRGLPGPALLAHVIVSKYGDHLPLYRLERIFGRDGVPLSRQTMCGWLAVGPTCCGRCINCCASASGRVGW